MRNNSNINFGLKSHRRVLKMDAKTGDLKTRNAAGEEVTFKTTRMKMDLENLQASWIQFRPGQGIVLQGNADNSCPGDDWQLGILVDVVGTDDVPELGGPIGEAEICSTSYVVREAFAKLYNEQYLPTVDDHPGEMPIVEVYGWRVIRMRAGTAYQPEMRIVGWSGNDEEAASIDDPFDVLS